MPPQFVEHKKLVDSFLVTFLDSKKESFSQVNAFGPDLLTRVKKLAVAGKTVRGSLVLFSFCFTNKKPSEEAIKLAASMELIHTALLIHDDIMDKDTKRRGMPAMHIQYKSEAVAMSVADVLFFLAFELIGTLKTDAVTLGRIVRLVGREYEAVGIAQMADVAKTAKTKVDIVSLYTYKTARYTFALPLMLGAILAGTTKEMLRYLESYGVAVGVLFQIRDDMLDHEKTLGTKDVEGYQKAAEESLKRLPQQKTLWDLLEFVMKRTK